MGRLFLIGLCLAASVVVAGCTDCQSFENYSGNLCSDCCLAYNAVFDKVILSPSIYYTDKCWCRKNGSPLEVPCVVRDYNVFG